MKKGLTNGLKPKIIKYVAILISMCYVLSPIQKQVSTLMHFVSHQLEMPHYVLNHENESEKKNHKHKINIVEHEHSFIDIVTTFLKHSCDGDSDNSNLNKGEWDKHFNETNFYLSINTVLVSKKTFGFTENNNTKEFFKKRNKPPQLHSPV